MQSISVSELFSPELSQLFFGKSIFLPMKVVKKCEENEFLSCALRVHDEGSEILVRIKEDELTWLQHGFKGFGLKLLRNRDGVKTYHKIMNLNLSSFFKPPNSKRMRQ